MKTGIIIGMGIFAAIINLIIYAALIGGGIYFLLWCLKHFGVIGA